MDIQIFTNLLKAQPMLQKLYKEQQECKGIKHNKKMSEYRHSRSKNLLQDVNKKNYCTKNVFSFEKIN